MACGGEVSLDLTQLNVEEDLPVFLISIDFDKSIAAKLKGM
jgi:hypothetical protein